MTIKYYCKLHKEPYGYGYGYGLANRIFPAFSVFHSSRIFFFTHLAIHNANIIKHSLYVYRYTYNIRNDFKKRKRRKSDQTHYKIKIYIPLYIRRKRKKLPQENEKQKCGERGSEREWGKRTKSMICLCIQSEMVGESLFSVRFFAWRRWWCCCRMCVNFGKKEKSKIINI